MNLDRVNRDEEVYVGSLYPTVQVLHGQDETSDLKTIEGTVG